MRAEGTAPTVAVASVIAPGSGSCACTASSYQRANSANGSGGASSSFRTRGKATDMDMGGRKLSAKKMSRFRFLRRRPVTKVIIQRDNENNNQTVSGFKGVFWKI